MSQDPNSKKSSATGFAALWDKILSFLGLGDIEDREKKQFLREIKKSIKRSKFKFLKVNGDQALPNLAKFFHQIYKTVGPAQTILANASSSEALKTIVIESQLPPDQIENVQKLDKERIAAQAQNMPLPELAEEVKKVLVDLTASFNLERVKKINHIYNTILVFLDFIGFNFYFMLKKFDASLPDKDYAYIPRFDSISGSYIIEDLKDFLEVYHFVGPNLPWDEVFEIFKFYKDLEVVARGEWRKTLTAIDSAKRSGILLDLVRHLDQNPYYKVSTKPPNEKIVEAFLENLRLRTENLLTKLKTEKRTNKKNQLVQAIFGTTGISRTKYYTQKGHITYSKKGLPGFNYVEPVNYLKAFLLDYYKRDIRELVNLLLVKGEWSSQALSQPFSDSFHQLMSFSENINQFDEELADDAEKGSKLKTLMYRSERDVNATNLMSQLLNDVNSRALELINGAGTHMIVVGKNIKSCMEDQAKPKHDLLFNWKALENSSEKDLRTWMSEVYKMIYYFIQLLQFFTKK